MKYKLILLPEAEKHLLLWKKSGQQKILRKILSIFEELEEHPHSGTGKVEQLRGNLQGLWSRRIDKATRIVYRIDEDVVTVFVISIKGHYHDK